MTTERPAARRFDFLLAYALVDVAVVQCRRDDSLEYDPDFRIPDAASPAVPVVGVLATLGVMTQMQPLVIGGGIALAGFGALWYAFCIRWELDERI
ncbi:hypothetical protein CV102_08055 [Natronococcus pandeyae]|uniref:Uncharacterized protein n=1 Tax=Natronococcus pandeyae TaxID=2055836 RepID=A0A8J8Q5C4_9EURY|nr:hypothetical protein [Natronococcus pandeyae]TYL39229.1 hypothetical protein CV102_08055 [Natronococcus pandeyae]